MGEGVYYNENNAFAAAWLEELIAAGAIPAGRVDRRSIEEVEPHDLLRHHQCHFFAGIGGWALALQIAGWPPERPVWTGSPPCQPFSIAGRRTGVDDPRHLWPEFHRLIAARRPPVLFGEQSSQATEWLAAVRDDLGALDYAVGAVPLEAALVGADHRRERYYFVADTDRVDDDGCGPAAGDVLRTRSKAPNLQPIENEGGVNWLSGDRMGTVVGTIVLGPEMGIVQNGIPGDVDVLRGAGNAIVPQLAAAFISAYAEARYGAHAG